MLLPEISAYILAQSTRFVAGPSTSATKAQVWLNRFPETSQGTAVALFESGGVAPLYTQAALSMERPAVQVISRSTSYATARLNAHRIYALLSAVENGTLSGVSYPTITPVQSPFDIGMDAGGHSMLSCNYIAEKAVSVS